MAAPRQHQGVVTQEQLEGILNQTPNLIPQLAGAYKNGTVSVPSGYKM